MAGVMAGGRATVKVMAAGDVTVSNFCDDDRDHDALHATHNYSKLRYHNSIGYFQHEV